MRKLVTTLALVIVACVAIAQVPTKFHYNVTNGNNVVDGANTYPFATVIVYKNAASKQAAIDAFANQYNYPATVADPADPSKTIPNPQSKQAFYNARISAFIGDNIRADAINAASKAAIEAAKTAVDAVVPPQ